MGSVCKHWRIDLYIYSNEKVISSIILVIKDILKSNLCTIKMESIEARFVRNRAAKKNAKNRIFGTIQSSIGQISHVKLALLRKVYCHEYEEMSDMIEHEIFQLTKKQTLLYSVFRKLELERIKLPSILKMDSEVSERLCEILCSKAENKAKIKEERYQKGEN